MYLTLKNQLVHACVYLFGGMVMAEFMPEREKINPLFLPRWGTNEGDGGFLKNLRGDFPCIPFGSASPGTRFPKGWLPDPGTGDPDGFAHGFAAHHQWKFMASGNSSVRIGILYPDNHPVKGVERLVSLSEDEPKVYFEDSIHVRVDCSLPIGLHPIFRLPEKPGTAELELPLCDTLYTYPGRVDKSSIFAPDTAPESAQAIPLRAGGTADITRLPLDVQTEELLMLCSVKTGHAALVNRAENYRVILQWDRQLLPNLLLWLSNRGRRQAPWNGENLCLGLEPIASAFDLGTAASLGKTPMPAKTSLALRKGERFVLKHALSLEIL